MPVVKSWNASKDNVDNVGGDGFYSGPIPTERGTYPCYLKIFELVTNKNSDPMIKGLAVVDAPKGHKFAKYNGYGIWFQQNITDQGAPYVNQLLNALSDGTEENSRAIRKHFWTKGAVTEKPLASGPKKSAGAILRIGPLKLASLEDGKVRILIFGKKGTDQDGEDRLEAARYLMKKVEEEDDIDEESDGLEEFAPDDEDESDEGDSDEDDADEDDEYDEDDGDDEEEDGDDDDYDEEGEDESDESDEDDDDDDEDEDEEVVEPTPIKKKTAAKRKEPAF